MKMKRMFLVSVLTVGLVFAAFGQSAGDFQIKQ